MEFSLNKNCFDFLRLFFAFNVLLSHIGELSQDKELFFLQKISNPYLAINGFFVISGFLVAKSYIRTNNLKTYLIKRVKRIIPAYIFVIFFFAIFYHFFKTVIIRIFFFITVV
ncbi:acyltransferase family protein [Flavobacterium haoranii]|uniref:acyltransferase family protein n=1 Tax=Flavobacterium haoranii TaxID=683124 RepID=UPI0037435017